MKKPQPTPFAIKMVDQWKVQVIWFDLKFENQLGKLNYKILVIVLNMENKIEAYFMFLGRSWMKQAKVHDNWGNNILTITSTNIMVTLSIIKCVNVKSSFQWPRNLDTKFDQEERLLSSSQEEKQLYNAMLKLWPMGEITLEELYFLKEIDYMVSYNQNRRDYAMYFFEHQLGKVLIK